MKKDKSVLVVGGLALVVFISAVLFTMGALRNTKQSFEKDGYILSAVEDVSVQGTKSEPIQFNSGASYRSNYLDQLTFKSTDKKDVTVNENDFIHYSDGSLSAFKNGVILDVENVNGFVRYYNIGAETPVTQNGDGYSASYMGGQLDFEDFIWKIDSNKYLIAGSSLELTLDKNNKKSVGDYIEVTYIDDGIVRIATAEEVFQTISPDCEVKTKSGVRINLTDRSIIGKNDTIVPLSQMVIDADENIEIQALSEVEEQTAIKIPTFTVEDGEDGEFGEAGTSGTGGTDGTDGKSGEGGKEGGGGSDGGSGGTGATGSTVGAGNGEEEEIVQSDLINVPKFTLPSFKVTAVEASGTIVIDDEEARLVADSVTMTVFDNRTGLLVSGPTEYRGMNFDFNINDLRADEEYRMVFEGEYRVDSKVYKRVFLDKVFRADDIGLTYTKNSATEDSVTFSVTKQSYSIVDNASLSLFVPGNSTPLEQPLSFTGGIAKVTFAGLDANTKYSAQLTNVGVSYGDGSSTLIPKYGIPEEYMTLKSTPVVGTPVVVVNKRDGAFEMQVSDIQDPDGGIIKYRYDIYEKNNPDVSKPVKSLTMTKNELASLLVDGTNLQRGVEYIARVVVVFNDNDKNVEISGSNSEAFRMDGSNFPTISFVQNEIKHDKIKGTLYIDMFSSNLLVSPEKKLVVSFKNSLGDTFARTYNTITPPVGTVYSIIIDEEGLRANDSYTISVMGWVDLREAGNTPVQTVIGTQIIQTKKMNTLMATFTDDTMNGSHAFTVNFNLTDFDTTKSAEYEIKTAKSIVFGLYRGNTMAESELVNTYTVYHTGDTHASVIADNYYGDSKNFVITEELFGIPSNQLTSTNYTIAVKEIVDYTPYKNVLPVERPSISIIKGAAAPPIGTKDDAFKVTPITSINYTNYGIDLSQFTPALDLTKHDDKTILGYALESKYDNSAKLATQFIYNLKALTTYDNVSLVSRADVDAATDIISYTLPVKANNAVPTLVVLFGTGTDKENGSTLIKFNPTMSRGTQYVATYTARLNLLNGGYIYPDNHPEGSGVILYSKRLDPPKQKPTFQFYPSTSDANSITWKYKYQDLDQAFIDQKLKITAGLSEGTSLAMVEGTTGYQEVLLKTQMGLSGGSIYLVEAPINLYTYPVQAYKQLLAKNIFDGSFVLPTSVKIRIVEDLPKNRLYLVYDGLTENDATRIAASTTIVTNTGGASITLNLPVKKYQVGSVGTYATEITFARLGSGFANGVLKFKTSLFVDNGKSGFDTGGTAHAFQILAPETKEGTYLVSSEKGTWAESSFASGSYAKGLTHTIPNLFFTNVMKNGTDSIALGYGPLGAQYKTDSGNYITAKSLTDTLMKDAGGNDTLTQNMGDITPEVFMDGSGDVQLTSGSFKFDVSSGLSLDGAPGSANPKFYVELYKEGESTPLQTRTIEVGADRQVYPVSFGSLSPSTTYYMKIRATKSAIAVHFYDPIKNINNPLYFFTTPGDVNFSTFNIGYFARSYTDKGFIANITADQSSGYYLRYELQEIDAGNVPVGSPLTHSVLKNNQIITNTQSASKNIKQPFNVIPGSVIKPGSKFELTVFAIKSNLDENTDGYDTPAMILGRETFTFSLRSLTAPNFGGTATGKFESGAYNINLALFPNDRDAVIVANEYKVRIFDDQGVDVTKPEIKNRTYLSTEERENIVFTSLEESKVYTIKMYGISNIPNTGGIDHGISTISDADIINYELDTIIGRTVSDLGVNVGTISVEKATNAKYAQLVFNDSVDLINITTITYNIYNDAGPVASGTIPFVPTPETLGSDTYYTFVIPEEFATPGSYKVQVQFSVNGVVVPQDAGNWSTHNYIYRGTGIMGFMQSLFN